MKKNVEESKKAQVKKSEEGLSAGTSSPLKKVQTAEGWKREMKKERLKK